MSDRGSRWLELSVRSPSTEDAISILADALVRLGGRGVLERDGHCLTYFQEPEDPDSFVDTVQAQLRSDTRLDDLEVTVRWQPHEDWAESWKRGLAPRRITDRIVVRPSWTDFETSPEDIVIVLDPGMAFGTAEHGTTRGCLRLLDRVVSSEDRVLDVGSGSGILAVTTALLGARAVVAIEGDEMSCVALRENVERNGVSDRVECVVEWADAEILRSRGPVDGVVANIETGVLRALLDGFRAALRVEGWLIVAGILGEEWSGFRADTEVAGFRFVELDTDGDWTSALFRSVA